MFCMRHVVYIFQQNRVFCDNIQSAAKNDIFDKLKTSGLVVVQGVRVDIIAVVLFCMQTDLEISFWIVNKFLCNVISMVDLKFVRKTCT